MHSNPRVSVIILNWNGLRYLKQFLPSVMATDYPNLEIIVADNHSSDGSVEFIRKNFSRIKLITFPANLGFAKGNNEAAKHSTGDYIVLLNSDAEVPSSWLKPMIAFMEKNPDAAACQPKILSHQNKNQFEYAGASGGFIDKYGYAFCRGRIFDYCEEDKGQYDNAREIFWATGACLCVRKSVIEKTKFLDGDFFAHFEEIDWCWRARLLGYKIYCVPESKIYHVGGGTLQKENPRKTFLNYRNNLIMLQKNLSLSRAWRIIPYRLLLDHASAYRALLKGNFRQYVSILKAHTEFIFLQPKWMMKRMRTRKFIHQHTNRLQEVSRDSKIVYQKNILWDYFSLRRSRRTPSESPFGKRVKRFSELEFYTESS